MPSSNGKQKKKFRVKVRKLPKAPKGKRIEGYDVSEAAMLQSNKLPGQKRILKSTAKRYVSAVRNRDTATVDTNTGHLFGGVSKRKRRKKKH